MSSRRNHNSGYQHLTSVSGESRNTSATLQHVCGHVRVIKIDEGRTKILDRPNEQIMIKASRWHWGIIVDLWVHGEIPSEFWVPSEMNIVHNGIVHELNWRHNQIMSPPDMKQMVLKIIYRMLKDAYKNDQARATQAMAAWVPKLVDAIITHVAASVPQ